MHYLPVVDLATGRTVGAEALVRWKHPEQGMVPPGEFIPVAEESDLIVALGDWAIFEACQELRRWTTLACGRSIAGNVSSRHFTRGLVSTVTAALRATGADPRTWSRPHREHGRRRPRPVAATLDEVRNLGVRSAIDDFGTGYCGLATSPPFRSPASRSTSRSSKP